jgi:DNA-binding transcriptional ArsR family regulator
VGTKPRKLDFIPPQLAAAMSHPTRVRAMTILLERTASPREIADEIGERLNNVSYHLKQLCQLGCVERVRVERAHGGRVIEHFYCATRRTYFDEAAWDVLNEKERLDLITVAIRIVAEDIEEAMAAGSFYGDDNAHISRSPMVLDQEGWREVVDLLTQATEDLIEISTRVTERCADGATASIHAKVALLQFRSPEPKETS